jgi:hypothetical protein
MRDYYFLVQNPTELQWWRYTCKKIKTMKKFIGLTLSLATLLFFSSCNESENPVTRSFRMGFQNSAPRVDFDLVLASLNLWTARSDAAMITTEVPWDELLSGQTSNQYVLANYKDLVDFYRTKNLELWIYIDPQNGLNRSTDSDDLLARGKSIEDADMRELYKKFVFAMDSILKPEHMGLALETNLIRLLAPSSNYLAVKQAATEAAALLKSKGSSAKLSISVQADEAWGKLTDNSFHGVAQDFIDFAFAEEMGVSSYPYFFFENPTDIPLDYYSKLFEGKSIACAVTEGGWSSANVSPFTSNVQEQAAYITHHGQILQQANAQAVFQLTFTDFDLANWPPPIPAGITPFASIGLVDINLASKPALASWDEIFKMPFKD